MNSFTTSVWTKEELPANRLAEYNIDTKSENPQIRARKLTIIRAIGTSTESSTDQEQGEPVINPGPGVFEVSGDDGRTKTLLMITY